MPKNLAPDIAISLSARIKSGEWSAANMLPNERALAQNIDASRAEQVIPLIHQMLGIQP